MNQKDEHYLKQELYTLVKNDSRIFEFLQAGSLDGIWYWDVEHPEEEWYSPRFKELFGYKDDEVPDTSDWWQKNIFLEDMEVAIDNFSKHCEDPLHPYDQVVRYRHKNGSTVWVRCRGLAVRDESGRPIRMLGAHTDVTALKQAQEKLEALNETLEKRVSERTRELESSRASALNMMKDAVEARRAEQNANEGLKREIAERKRAERDLSRHRDHLEQLVKERTAELQTVNDQLRNEIAERKHSGEMLRKLSERLTLATKSAEIGIWDWDVVNNKLAWDDTMYSLYGISPDQFGAAYEAWQKGVYPEDLPVAEERVRMALRGERDFDTEFRVVWPDSTVRTLKAYALVERSENGDPVNMIGVNFDITETKRAEEEIKSFNAELEAANQELESFSYSVSHDLRAPLRSVDGFSQALLEDYEEKLDAGGREYLQRVRAASQRMGQLIDALLNLSRITRGEMRRETVDLSTIARELADELHKSEPARQATFAIHKGLVQRGLFCE